MNKLSDEKRAMTQHNLGAALTLLGEREGGTERLEHAVAAFRAALKESTRERVPLDWAATQHNLGAALQTLGKRESGTERLEQAVAAYRAALEERTRERVPLDWVKSRVVCKSERKLLDASVRLPWRPPWARGVRGPGNGARSRAQ